MLRNAFENLSTEATLALVLAKLSADPATQTTLAALLAELRLKADLTDTQPVSGPATNAELRAVPLPVTVTDSSADCTSLFAGNVSATGVGAPIDTSGFCSLVFQFNGSWVGSFILEGSTDGSNGSWSDLLCMSLDAILMDNVITSNGQYVLKATTRYVRFNAVQLKGTVVMSVIGRESDGSHAADRLSLALDQSNGVRMSVATPDLQKDQYGALYLSDAPYVKSGSGSANGNILFVMDTAGYQSIGLQLFGVWVATVTFQSCNDGASWVSVSGWPSTAATAAISSATYNGLFSIPCVGRYFRVILTAYTSGTVQSVAYMRNQPAMAGFVLVRAVTSVAGMSVESVHSCSRNSG